MKKVKTNWLTFMALRKNNQDFKPINDEKDEEKLTVFYGFYDKPMFSVEYHIDKTNYYFLVECENDNR